MTDLTIDELMTHAVPIRRGRRTITNIIARQLLATMQRETKLREWLEVLIDDLTVEIEDRYHHTKHHPAMRKKYERDMTVILGAKEALVQSEYQDNK